MDDVKLIWSIRDAKTSLTTLLQRGQIGDELWERFLLAEKELEAEIVEVVGEANTFEPGYGQRIFGHASDMVSHERWKEIYRDIPKARAEERESPDSSLAVIPLCSASVNSSLTLPGTQSNAWTRIPRTLASSRRRPTSLLPPSPSRLRTPCRPPALRPHRGPH